MSIDVSALIVIALNAMAWVWGAGRLQQSVRSLEKTSTKLEDAVEKLTHVLSDHDKRLAVLESKDEQRRWSDR